MKSRISYSERSETVELHEYIDDESELQITNVEVKPGPNDYDSTRFTVEGFLPAVDRSAGVALEPSAVNRLLDQFRTLERLEPTNLSYRGVESGEIRFEFFCYGLEDEPEA
jgi:hypothetical protein